MSSNKFTLLYGANGLKTLDAVRADANRILLKGEYDRVFIYELVETISVERKIKRESHRPPSGIQLEETT